MAEVKVQIDSESVDSEVVRTILESKFGEGIEKAIEEELDNLRRRSLGSGGALGQAVSQQMQRMTIDLIKDQYTEKIEQLIRERVTDDFVNELFETMWSNFKARV